MIFLKNDIKSYKNHHLGFTLMELIGVMAIISILSAVLAPSVFDAIKAAVSDAESANVKTLLEALEESINENKRIPTQTANSWVTAISAYIDFPRSKIEYNRRGFRRRLYIDPKFFTTSNTVFPGYTQISGLTQKPNFPRLMLVSDLTKNIVAPPTTNAAFSAIWDQTTGAAIVESDDVKIERMHLASLFHRIIFLNSDSTQSAYSVEGGSAFPVPIISGGTDGSLTRYLLHTSSMDLFASPYPSGNLLTRTIIKSEQSYRYESSGGNWSWARL